MRPSFRLCCPLTAITADRQPYIAGALIQNYTFDVLGLKFTFPTESLITHFLISLMFPDEWLFCTSDVP